MAEPKKYEIKTIKTSGVFGAHELRLHMESGWEPVSGADAGKGRTMLRREKPPLEQRMDEFFSMGTYSKKRGRWS